MILASNFNRVSLNIENYLTYVKLQVLNHRFESKVCIGKIRNYEKKFSTTIIIFQKFLIWKGNSYV